MPSEEEAASDLLPRIEKLADNGFFVRWADLYSQTHPLDSAEIAKFLQKIEL